jgi:hypothetical protein
MINGQRIHASLTPDVIMAAAEESMFGMTDAGFCIACGEETLHIEPDAEGYTCESCERPTVYGAEQLLFYIC